MRERPILMATESVKAILEDRKTQTRRILKPQPVLLEEHHLWGWVRGHYWNTSFGQADWQDGESPTTYLSPYCPYGQVGDRLWVREKFAIRDDGQQVMHYAGYMDIIKALELPHFNIAWKPSIHMPRWASRITLEITEVRVERVQEITEEDAKAEGSPSFWLTSKDGKPFDTVIPSLWFEDLWDSLNAKRGYGWSVNPWVWVLGFRKIECSA